MPFHDLRAAPLVRVKVKLTVKNAVCNSLGQPYRVNVTVTLTLTLTMELLSASCLTDENLLCRGEGRRGAEVTLAALPHLTKFLLIAAYLASYNPASSDVRIFVVVRLEACEGVGGYRSKLTPYVWACVVPTRMSTVGKV